jgi:hypothetical protein
MAQRLNSSFFVFITILLLFIPVSADLQNTTPPPVPYTIKLFSPSPGMIHSDQIMDLINGPDKNVLLATSFGLSSYDQDGTWSTRHMDLDNISEGLMSDYVTAIEYGPDDNLWIGYSKGIQVYNGIYYQTITDQQLLKDTNIKDLQRWDNDMWVATGHSGIHRVRNSTWTWYQPGSRDGPGFYEVRSMTLDPATGSMPDELVIATVNEGLWVVPSREDPVRFEMIADKDSTFGSLMNVRRDPKGGVYFFNGTEVVHYSREQGFVPVLTGRDLTITGTPINDLAAANDGKLYLATDDGIYIWEEGAVYRHLNRFEGIGASSVVKTMNLDAENRAWFSTGEDVGYYSDRSSTENALIIETSTTTPSPSPTTESQSPGGILTPRENTVASNTDDSSAVEASGEGVGAIIDPVIRAIMSILSGFGVH